MNWRNLGLNKFFLGFMFLNGLLLSILFPFFFFSSWPKPSPLLRATKYATKEQYDFHVHNDTTFTVHCKSKKMVTVNGMFPGPEMVVYKNQGENVSVFVNVYNEVHNEEEPFGITIHWHGVKQRGNPWSDGPEYITQCPIRFNMNFTHEIIFSDEVGTVWWHAHSDWSRASVHGAVIIRPPQGTNYPYDPHPLEGDERTIVIASWYDGRVEEQYERARNKENISMADSYTINGLAGNCFQPCESANITIFQVESDKTYLLHIVNAVLNQEIFFAIANHTLRVVAMDGAYVKPIDSDYIMLGPGNTIDVLVTTNQSNGSYYMAAGYYTTGDQTFNTSTATALLQYETPSNPSCPTHLLPSQNDTGKADSFTDNITSKDQQHVENYTVQYIIDISTYGGPMIHSSLSNISFVLPNATTLLKASISCINGAGECNNSNVYNTSYPMNYTQYPNPEISGTNVILVDYGAVVEIVFQGSSHGPEAHPMHVHGYNFFVMGRGYGERYNITTSPASYDTTRPPLLNTVSVRKEGWAAIRFTANNPGVWFIHCHLERHATWGMATALIVKEGNNASMQRSPIMPPC